MTEQTNSACPFCGGEVDPTGWLRADGARGPECDGCGATASSMEVWEQRAALAQPSPALELPLLTTGEMKDLHDFYSSLCDGVGHRVEKNGMRRLAEIGAVESVGFGKHRLTKFGEYLLRIKHPPVAQAGQVPDGWKAGHPTQPGAYYVRGFRLFEGDSPAALVEVVLDGDDLVCNLHESNSEEDLGRWSLLSDFNEGFEWFGPLAAPPAQGA